VSRFEKVLRGGLLVALLFVILGGQPPLQAATALGAYAIVQVPQLNIRSGPSTDASVVKTVVAGQTVPVIGRLADCTWLQVVLPPNVQGWLLAEYVALSRSCSDLPAVAVKPALTKPSAAPPLLTAAVPPSTAVAAPQPQPPAATCAGSTGESYGALTIDSPPSDRPAAAHPDLNLTLRGYAATSEPSALLSFGPVHQIDHQAPQLRQLFTDQRSAGVQGVYQVRDWDWGCNCPGDLLAQPPVTLVSLAVTPGEAIRTPDSPRTIGDGYEALALYATADQITLKFTREDNVISGYTLHVAGICVDPQLLALYGELNSAGRGRLPALRGGQAFGQAQGGTIQVAIRDNGQFLDPRYLENWWR
jgi:hypothetical protein